MGRYGEREAGGIRGHNIFLRRRRAPYSARSHSAFDHRPCPSLCARSYISTWTRSTLPWNSATTRAARPCPWSWPGPDRARWSARPRTRRGASACIRPCRRCARSALSAGGLCAADFNRYREVSRQVRQIYARHTDLIEPLSLDEAYLDVTVNKGGLPSATEVAQVIRHQIRQETGLTASAGVAPNKFLAKIASDWNKPDGLFVIRPSKVLEFLAPLPVRKVPGVGKDAGAAGAAGHPDRGRPGHARGAGAGALFRPPWPPALNWRAASTSARSTLTSRCSRCRRKPRSRKTCAWRRWAEPSTAWRAGLGPGAEEGARWGAPWCSSSRPTASAS